MKALTVRQPWASLIVEGTKDVENRTWQTTFRGRLLIHAGKTPDVNALNAFTLIQDARLYRFGYVIGSVELVDCVRDSESLWAVDGMWHWVLENPKRLARPKPMKGQPSLFEVSTRVVEGR